MGGGLENRCVGRVYGVDGAVGGGLESRCVGRVYGADGAVRVARHHPHRKHDLRTGSQDHHPSKNSVQKTISAATQHLMLLMMDVCTRNMSR